MTDETYTIGKDEGTGAYKAAKLIPKTTGNLKEDFGYERSLMQGEIAGYKASANIIENTMLDLLPTLEDGETPDVRVLEASNPKFNAYREKVMSLVKDIKEDPQGKFAYFVGGSKTGASKFLFGQLYGWVNEIQENLGRKDSWEKIALGIDQGKRRFQGLWNQTYATDFATRIAENPVKFQKDFELEGKTPSDIRAARSILGETIVEQESPDLDNIVEMAEWERKKWDTVEEAA